jgi:hypothetical protein
VAAASAAVTASLLLFRGDDPETPAAVQTAQFASMPFAMPGDAATASTAVPEAPRPDVIAVVTLTPDAIQLALAETPRERRDLVMNELLARLVGHDAPAAARIAERVEDSYLREVALRVIAQHWARSDPAAAVDWAASLGDGLERDTALANAALELAVPRPRLALAALERRSTPPSPDSVLEGVVQQWATNDFAAAYAWTTAQPAGPEREALLLRLVFARVEQSPADAAWLATTAFSVEAQRIDAIATVAMRWSEFDPAAVRDWALTLDARARERVSSELALLGLPIY